MSGTSDSGACVEIVDPREDSIWDERIAAHPDASIFHTTAWAHVLNETYGHKPTYFVLSQNGRDQVCLPLMEVVSPLTGRRGVALPFSDFCPPLFFAQTQMPLLQKHLSELGRAHSWKYLEVRGGPPLHAESLTNPATFYEHSLALNDPSSLRSNFSDSARRALRKAERSGLVIQITRAQEAITKFYELHVRTRRKHGAPPQPMRFFQNIYRHLIETGFGFIVIARKLSEPIAAAVYFTHGENAVYKFGASDERFLESRANNLVMWEAIKHLCASGFKNLHLGRTAPDNAGLRRFKLGWGVEEKALIYWRLDPVTEKWTNRTIAPPSFAQHIFAHFPLRMNRWAGSLLYPHLD